MQARVPAHAEGVLREAVERRPVPPLELDAGGVVAARATEEEQVRVVGPAPAVVEEGGDQGLAQPTCHGHRRGRCGDGDEERCTDQDRDDPARTPRRPRTTGAPDRPRQRTGFTTEGPPRRRRRARQPIEGRPRLVLRPSTGVDLRPAIAEQPARIEQLAVTIGGNPPGRLGEAGGPFERLQVALPRSGLAFDGHALRAFRCARRPVALLRPIVRRAALALVSWHNRGLASAAGRAH